MYLYHGTEQLRCGYTTGACATAAAYAAAVLLLTGERRPEVTLELSGEQVPIPVQSHSLTPAEAICTVLKDSGDDPDVTNGMAICAAVSRREKGFCITAGEGIGTVTRPGLDQPPGAPAINSVPRRMILAALEEASALCGGGGLEARIFAPEGEEIARRTYNPHMGITGGISILGTTGIVRPMSHEALIATIRAEASMHRAAGERTLLLTLGNYSDQFLALHLPVPPERGVKCSNFIGEALDIGVAAGFSEILLIGHAGKLVKLGAGIMNTHSAQADGRMEVLTTCAMLAGARLPLLRQLPDCATVDAAFAILAAEGMLDPTMSVLTERIAYHLQKRVKAAVRTEAILFSAKLNRHWQTAGAEELLKNL